MGKDQVRMTTPPKRGRGQPRGEPTKQIRVYTADVPMLCRNGETQASAVRRLLAKRPRIGQRPNKAKG